MLCVGALEPRKAPELLAGAHARARARGLQAELVFVGAGRLAARLEGRPGVRLLGPVQGERAGRAVPRRDGGGGAVARRRASA